MTSGWVAPCSRLGSPGGFHPEGMARPVLKSPLPVKASPPSLMVGKPAFGQFSTNEAEAMRYRKIPGTDVAVSEVGFGVWTVSTGWWGEFTDEAAVQLLRRAYSLGVTLFDTADAYANGRGETLVAAALRDVRQKIAIVDKFGYDFYSQPGERRGQQELPHDFSRKFIKFACEQSLERLATDYIDVYLAHNPRLADIRNDELFAALDELKREGKIRAGGVALGPAIGWLVEGVAAIRERNIGVMHMIYNLLEQNPGRQLIAAGRPVGTSFLIRVPHSSGMLEGKYTADTKFSETDHRSHRPQSWLTNGLKKIDTLKFLHEGRGMTLGQAAIKFILGEPLVASVVPNIYNEEQLAEFAAAPDKADLTRQDFERVEERYRINFGVDEAPMQFKGLAADSPEGRQVLSEAGVAAAGMQAN